MRLRTPGVATVLALLRLIVAGALLAAAVDWRSPLLASYRTLALTLLIAAPTLLIAYEIRQLRAAPAARPWLAGVVVPTTTIALAVMLALEGASNGSAQPCWQPIGPSSRGSDATSSSATVIAPS